MNNIILDSLKWINFSREQISALEDAYRTVLGNNTLLAALRNDTEKMDGVLSIPLNEMTASYGIGMDIYPTLPLLAGIPSLEEKYRAKGIPDRFLTDALSDIPIWIENCKRRTGIIGMHEYHWISRFFRMELFRLGRLEFEPKGWDDIIYVIQTDDGLLYLKSKSGYDAEKGSISGYPVDTEGVASSEIREMTVAPDQIQLRPGDPVLSVHIPEGPGFTPSAVNESFKIADTFFEEHFPDSTRAKAFMCGSWLLSPSWQKICPEGNIGSFQRRFRIVDVFHDRQMFERVFDSEPGDVNTMPANTTLQKRIRDAYNRGMKCPSAYGLIFK